MRGHITPVEDGLLQGREQCLTVNIFRPHGIRGKLPVAVYVYGGAYNRGRLSILYTHPYPSASAAWSVFPAWLYSLRVRASMHNMA